MSAARKIISDATPAGREAKVGPSIALANGQAYPGANPVHDHQLRLASAFAPELESPSYPGIVKLAIVIGTPTVFWAGLIGAGVWLANRF